MTATPRLAILLSTYNGERFLAAQLDSLLAQTYNNFVLVVRDDGSSDGTLEMLQNYAGQNRERIHLLDDNTTNNLGARDSFGYLIDYVLSNKATLKLDSAYMMFCDQDDVWFPEKIEVQMSALLAAQTENPGIPLLVHSDLHVVSETLESIAPSLAAFQGLETSRNGFNQMVISNLVTGCTALMNEELARKCLPLSNKAIMHDWWVALVAAAFGKVVYLDQPLIHYRQHGSNTIGAKQHQQAVASQPSFWRRLFRMELNEHLQEVAVQAQDFLLRFGTELNDHQRRGLRVSAKMDGNIGLLQRIYYRRARRF